MKMSSNEQLSIIPPSEKLPHSKAMLFGLQHLIAMFGATVLAPRLMGLDSNIALLFSGVGTLIFYVWMKKAIPDKGVPSYLGSSFAFIAAVTAIVANDPANISKALGGVVAVGLVYFMIGWYVIWRGKALLEKLMPPVVTGVIVGIIGLNLAKVAVANISSSPADMLIGLATILFIAVSSNKAPRLLKRFPVVCGVTFGYLFYCAFATGGYVTPIDFNKILHAGWFMNPSNKFQFPKFDLSIMLSMMPIALILIAENLGHLKAVGAMVGNKYEGYEDYANNVADKAGHAFMADGASTMLAGFFGGAGVTTYAENIGVMSVTRNYATQPFIWAGIFAILLSFVPWAGALINSIPLPVLGGLAFVVFGLITAMAGKIWIDGKVDFSRTENLLIVGIPMVMGAGDLTLKVADFQFGGIFMATLSAFFLSWIVGNDQKNNR